MPSINTSDITRASDSTYFFDIARVKKCILTYLLYCTVFPAGGQPRTAWQRGKTHTTAPTGREWLTPWSSASASCYRYRSDKNEIFAITNWHSLGLKCDIFTLKDDCKMTSQSDIHKPAMLPRPKLQDQGPEGPEGPDPRPQRLLILLLAKYKNNQMFKWSRSS